MYEGQWQQFLKEARAQVNSVAERQVTCVGEQGLYDEIAPAPQVGWRPVVP
jgi:hypothetical protein